MRSVQAMIHLMRLNQRSLAVLSAQMWELVTRTDHKDQKVVRIDEGYTRSFSLCIQSSVP